MSLKTERMEMTIQREISHILQFELKNPNLGFCTVTDVQCTSDLSQAKVYVTFLGKQGRNDAGMRVLNQSKEFYLSTIRTLLLNTIDKQKKRRPLSPMSLS